LGPPPTWRLKWCAYRRVKLHDEEIELVDRLVEFCDILELNHAVRLCEGCGMVDQRGKQQETGNHDTRQRSLLEARSEYTPPHNHTTTTQVA
jgi:hypothetical protein